MGKGGSVAAERGSSLDVLCTKQYHKKVTDYFNRQIFRYPRTNVAESLVHFTERKRVMTAGTSGRPGKFDFNKTPYLREIHECLSEYTDIYELAIIKATQVGATELMLNWTLYCIYYGIGPVLYSTADQTLAGEHMEKRVDPMIEAADMQDCITPPVQKKGNKATGDTKTAKSFAGTFMKAVGPNSEGQMRSLPARYLQVDETDVYPKELKGGGNTIKKLQRRTDSYGKLKKNVYASTPKTKQASEIEPLFEQGTMEYYHIPCPECGHMQHLEWQQFKWEKDEEGNIDLQILDGKIVKDPTYYECNNPECGYHMKDHEKVKFMQERGHGGSAEWRGTKEPDRPGFRSFHISGLYGFRSWLDIALQWIEAQGDPTLLQDFINDVLGETYTEKIDKPDEHFLQSRAEDWEQGYIPNGVLLLTLGADIQKDRIEAQLTGWNANFESWVLRYEVFPGSPDDIASECWQKLDEMIGRDYVREDGTVFNVLVSFVDAGYLESRVNQFCDQFTYNPKFIRGVFPVVGRKKKITDPMWRAYKNDIATPMIHVNDQKSKQRIYQNLKRV